MPTASSAARTESLRWVELAERNRHSPTEKEIVVVHDPAADLQRRAHEWGYVLEGFALSSLAEFAGALAHTEAEAWDDGSLDVATRAFDARRRLLGDRIIHWAVPWLLAIGADEDARFLLEVGDEMRVAPSLTGHEGLMVSGEDSFGPLGQRGGIWSGWVGEDKRPDDLVRFWTDLAGSHPGSARLWYDLAARASRPTRADKHVREEM